MDITVRNEAILKLAKQGHTLQEIVNIYGTTTSNISVLLNRLGYRKCEIVVQAQNTLLMNQTILKRAKELFVIQMNLKQTHSKGKILKELDKCIDLSIGEYKAKHS